MLAHSGISHFLRSFDTTILYNFIFKCITPQTKDETGGLGGGGAGSGEGLMWSPGGRWKKGIISTRLHSLVCLTDSVYWG